MVWIDFSSISFRETCQVYYLYHFISSLGTKLDLLWHTKLYSATSFPKLYFSILSIFIANTYIYMYSSLILYKRDFTSQNSA